MKVVGSAGGHLISFKWILLYIDAKPFIFRTGSPPAQIFSTFHTAWADKRRSA